jgi:hypothetical protein
MRKTLSPAAVVALKEALTNVYWLRRDLRTFLTSCMQNNHILSNYDWNNETKRDIVSNLIDEMLLKNQVFIHDMTKICNEICNMQDFSHLQNFDNAIEKIQKAKNAVAQLKKLVEPHQNKIREENRRQEHQKIVEETRKKTQASDKKLNEMKESYLTLSTSNEPQMRGFKLEKLLKDLFELYDLDPKASFKITGEQIDGAFSLDHAEYLFEAKWQKQSVDNAELLIFSGKVEGKLENTLGLFLSINGFSPTGIEAFTKGKRSSIILMDGGDVMAILEERIKIVDLLRRKKQHASQTGEIYFTYSQMIAVN